jgi:hypothetical protein
MMMMSMSMMIVATVIIRIQMTTTGTSTVGTCIVCGIHPTGSSTTGIRTWTDGSVRSATSSTTGSSSDSRMVVVT